MCLIVVLISNSPFCYVTNLLQPKMIPGTVISMDNPQPEVAEPPPAPTKPTEAADGPQPNGYPSTIIDMRNIDEGE